MATDEVQDDAYKCPSCGSTAIVSKSPRASKDRERPEQFTCENCHAHFDEAIHAPDTPPWAVQTRDDVTANDPDTTQFTTRDE